MAETRDTAAAAEIRRLTLPERHETAAALRERAARAAERRRLAEAERAGELSALTEALATWAAGEIRRPEETAEGEGRPEGWEPVRAAELAEQLLAAAAELTPAETAALRVRVRGAAAELAALTPETRRRISGWLAAPEPAGDDVLTLRMLTLRSGSAALS